MPLGGTVPRPHLLYLRVLEVVSPQRSDLVLTADIPHSEADVLVFYRLHVETWEWAERGNGCVSCLCTNKEKETTYKTGGPALKGWRNKMLWDLKWVQFGRLGHGSGINIRANKNPWVWQPQQKISLRGWVHSLSKNYSKIILKIEFQIVGTNLITNMQIATRHHHTLNICSLLEKLKVNVVNVPIVGIVVTISPSFSLYSIVVFPAASNPTAKEK